MKIAILLAALSVSPLFSFCQKMKAFEENDKWGFKDRMGNVIVEPIFDYEYEFTKRDNGTNMYVDCGNRILVKRNGKYGYTDSTGKEIIACQYKDASSFCQYANKKAFVKRDKKWFYLSPNGNKTEE